MSENFKDALEKAGHGKAILFCGAGASLDSLGFNLEELPAANPLLRKFNEHLGRNFSKIQIAASKVADQSIRDYFKIITECFKVKSVSDDMVSIMSFPWQRVYSTNYDDSVELACAKIAKKCQTLTAKDKPTDILEDRIPIIHLHGFVNHFRIDTIREECILDYGSNVANTVYEGPWATELKNDISTADIVVFLGYSLYDPEIAKLTLQGGNSKSKIFFINHRIEDEELIYMQERFGTPVNIEKDGLARTIIDLPVGTDVTQRRYICFRPSKDFSVTHRVINYEDLSDLFLFGRVQDDVLQADIVSGQSNYIICPSDVEKVKSELKNGKNLFSLYSPLGHGKTVLTKILTAELGKTYDVFLATRNQDEFMEEVRSIVANFSTPIFILDDYYKYSRHHKELSKLSPKDAIFIFTSRLSVHEIRKEELSSQFLNHEVVDIRIGHLSDVDAEALVPLINQAGMWGNMSDFPSEKKAKALLSVTENGFQANFADILVGLMSSSEMIGRIKKELEILKGISSDAYSAVLLSMYLEFTNNHIDEFIIDQAMKFDLVDLNSTDEVANIFRLFFSPSGGAGGYFKGSVFAKYAMEKICVPEDIIGTIEQAANNLANSRPLFPEVKLVLVDLLRFNYLKVIAGKDHSRLKRISKLYSNLSSNSNLNNDDLFWNAFGMSERSLSNFDSAVKHFRTSISYAKLRGPNYVPYHAQNQLIVCLLERAITLEIETSTAFTNLGEVLSLLTLQADDERTHGRGQAFAWHKEFIAFLEIYKSKFDSGQRALMNVQIQKYVSFIVRNVSGWESRTEAALTVRKLQSFIANNPA